MSARSMVRYGGGERGCPVLDARSQNRPFLYNPYGCDISGHRPENGDGDAGYRTRFPGPGGKRARPCKPGCALEKLSDETDELASKISDASRFALSIGKQGFYAQIDQADDKALHYAKHTIVMNNTSEDSQYGIKSFLEKKPVVEWKDR